MQAGQLSVMAQHLLEVGCRCRVQLDRCQRGTFYLELFAMRLGSARGVLATTSEAAASNLSTVKPDMLVPGQGAA